MKVYLIQHAEAKREEEDPTRPLSERGIFDIKKIANFLKGKINVKKILHSGKLRAKQTAEILAEIISCEEVKEIDGLAPMDNPKIILERLNEEKDDIILVGHLPHLEKLSSILLIKEEKKIIEFKMGGIVCLERKDREEWTLQWMLIPQIL